MRTKFIAVLAKAVGLDEEPIVVAASYDEVEVGAIGVERVVLMANAGIISDGAGVVEVRNDHGSPHKMSDGAFTDMILELDMCFAELAKQPTADKHTVRVVDIVEHGDEN